MASTWNRVAWQARRAVLALLAAVGLLHVAITFTPVLWWWNSFLARPWSDAPGDILIVLGAEEIDGEFLGRSSYWRSISAVREWKKGGVRRILVSGGGGGPPVAETMKQFMVFSGVSETAVETETAAGNTHENALFAARRLNREPGRKVLLTSDCHMRRAYGTFRRAGLDVIGRPAPDVGKQIARRPERWPALLRLSAETAALAYYWAKGWL